ncbi:MAG: 5'-nucleotidase domain-containing protein [Ignavibacteria bacterium]|nr:MAG: 5'-nucleotidase domain-containing protein [Ignavibacteria bacterium]KAF0160855.1 MAG: 5'-nucleotidase domain-containing protein [Ignavibacteria bacterium]
MKKLAYTSRVLVFAIILISGAIINAQTAITQWGFLGANGPTRTGGWSFVPGTGGNAGVAGNQSPNGTWSVIRGAFDAITPTAEQAIVITGKIQFTGAGPSTWSGLRFGLFRHDNPGALQNAGTSTAVWSGSEGSSFGYMFAPHSGTNNLVSWASGGNGTQGVIRGGTWLSTFGSAHRSLGVITPKPSRAVLSAGTYDFAISVRPTSDGKNELKYFLMKEDKSYWIGGTFFDDEKITASFNGVCFGLNGGNGAETSTIRGMSLIGVRAGLGAAITIPEAPWVDYYIPDWGFVGNKAATRTGGWDFVPGDVIGNAGVKGTKAPNGTWSAVRGQFLEPITPTVTKALTITGKIKFVGAGPSTWSGLRFGVFRHDSAGVLRDTTKPTAFWTGKEADAFGYMFVPRSGSNEQVSWSNGNGTQGVIRGGSWISTFGNSHKSLGVINNRPVRSVMDAGTYNFAMSVRPTADGKNEIKFFLIKEDNKYWYGGTVIDDERITTSFNGVCFALNGGNGAETSTIREMSLLDVKVSMGNVLTVPEAPWQAYYVDAWGNTPQGRNWPILNTADYIIGNASMGADKRPSGWATIKGGFAETHTPTVQKALIVKGTFEYVGGGANNAYTWLRYALTFQDSAKLNDQNKTTANWTGTRHFGYQFTPRSGVGELANGAGGSGSLWTIRDGNWNSTWSNNGGPVTTVLQAPARAVATAGVYDWAISVQPLANGSNEIRWYFVKKAAAGKPTDYWFGGSYIDPNPVSTKFNGILFGVANDLDETCKQVNINDVQVDMGNPIVVPEAPWQSFYVDTWGILGQRRGNAGWVMTPGDVVGDVTISGKAAPATDFAVVRGQFATTVTPSTAKALLVTGKFELVGGGFDNWGLRYGLFNSDAGKVETTLFYNWLGSETNHSGYLFFAQSNSKHAWSWPGGTTGSFGGIINGIPIYNYGATDYPVGTALSTPQTAVSRAGVYDFAISVQPLADGTAEIRHFLTSRDKRYYWAERAVDKNNPRATTRFNSIVFGLNSSSTTAMKIHDVKVDIGSPITIPTPVSVEDNISSLPTEYQLNQNYPNPFNPTTTIEFALPKAGQVKLVVYDVLGSVVAELVNKELNAGYHKVDFNAANISSGVYFYSIKTGEFNSVKKLILLK